MCLNQRDLNQARSNQENPDQANSNQLDNIDSVFKVLRLNFILLIAFFSALVHSQNTMEDSNYQFDDNNEIAINQETKVKQSIANFGHEHFNTAYAWVELGWFWEAHAEVEKSITCFKKALAIHTKAALSDDLEIARINDYIGNVYHANRQYQLALDYYLLVDKLYETDQKVIGFEKADIAINWRNIARVLSELKQYERALEYAKKAHESDLQAYGSDDSMIADSLVDLAMVYNHLQQHEKALQHLTIAISVEERHLGKQDILVAEHKVLQADTLMRLGKKETALNIYRLALSTYEKEVGPEHRLINQLKNKIRNIEKVNKRHEKLGLND
ncbi:tetratricopeptide repeat protein [Aliikangiella coralliicola]|uniref:Tetratricopeptide repeat protein n=1 Tax=Aliikangiella coralliicola TaxID=2592383 RepID=A0A545UCA4_9GAMM|nr:tetratricopeptide repeat protein [Aliikangiella coralliicola]TQV87095.1 tetratricopeptide repeat protein [Aliikangiella coralliicola]